MRAVSPLGRVRRLSSSRRWAGTGTGTDTNTYTYTTTTTTTFDRSVGDKYVRFGSINCYEYKVGMEDGGHGAFD